MRWYSKLLCGGLLAWSVFSAADSHADSQGDSQRGQGAFTLTQVTVADRTGAPLRGVAARIALENGKGRFLSVFSGADGRFPSTPLTQQSRALGPAESSGVEFIGRGYGFESIDRKGAAVVVTMSREALRAQDVPAAAWLQQWPQSRDARVTAAQCVQCHQLPGLNTHQFAQAIGTMPQERGRTEAWHGNVKSMRAVSAQVTSRISRKRFTGVDSSWRTGSEAFLSARLENAIAPFLAGNMPRDFSRAVWKPAWDMGDAQAVRGVEVEEFRFGAEVNSWFREVTYSPKTGTVIGVDLGGNRVYELDPKTGARRWIEIPVDAANTAPHTINIDAAGFVWISLEDINGAGRYDPVKRSWKIYRDVFDGHKISHDFATDSNGFVATDPKGRVWISLVSHNHMAALDVQGGAAELFALPPRHDGLKEPTLPYGVVITADRKFVWVSQHASDTVLKLSTDTGKVVATVQYPEGYAPRRMTIDEQDRVWVALSGAGALGLIQGDKAAKEFPLPMAVSYPYNTLWDPQRKRVWVGTSNAGELLEFDPAAAKFKRYALPAHSESYIRQLARDPATGALWTAYAAKLGEKAEVAVVRIAPEKL